MATIMEPRRALILYATMTKNTEKVATWFNETFNEYGWETYLIRIMPNTNWAELQDKLYFDDYDLVCLGFPHRGRLCASAHRQSAELRRRRRPGKRRPEKAGRKCR